MVQRDPRAFAFGFSIGAFSAPQRAGRSTSSPFRAGSTASARYRHRRAGGQPQHVRARDRATGAAWRLLGALGAEIPPGFESNMPLRVGPAPLQRVRRRIRQERRPGRRKRRVRAGCGAENPLRNAKTREAAGRRCFNEGRRAGRDRRSAGRRMRDRPDYRAPFSTADRPAVAVVRDPAAVAVVPDRGQGTTSGPGAFELAGYGS